MEWISFGGNITSPDSAVDGKRGSRAYCGSRRAEQPAFIQAGTIETTGAGDTFGACCLHYILEHGVAGLGTTELEEMLRFANAAASIVTTRRGAARDAGTGGNTGVSCVIGTSFLLHKTPRGCAPRGEVNNALHTASGSLPQAQVRQAHTLFQKSI